MSEFVGFPGTLVPMAVPTTPSPFRSVILLGGVEGDTVDENIETVGQKQQNGYVVIGTQ